MGILKEKGCVKTDKTLKAFFLSDFFFLPKSIPSVLKQTTPPSQRNPALHLINSEAQAHIY